MKLLSITIILCLTIQTIVQGQAVRFSMKGSTHKHVDSVFLYEYTENATYEKFASAKVDKNGAYVFSKKIVQPNLFMIEVGDLQKIIFIGNDKIKITETTDDIQLSGDTTNLYNERYNNSIRSAKMGMIQTSQQLETLSNKKENADIKDSLRSLEALYTKEITNKTMDFILNNPNSFVSLYLLNWNAKSVKMDQLKTTFAKLSSSLRQYPLYTDLQRKIELFKSLSNGNIAPDINRLDNRGNMISLNAMKRKYILIDFWASWCVPCVDKIPELKRIAASISNDTLAIICISLDQGEKNWKYAMNKYKMDNFININLKEGFKDELSFMYDITSIPTSYLIDRDGKIIGSNLDANSIIETINANKHL